MTKILCVEDEPTIRIEIAEFLIDEGYKVLQASNGAEGLEAVLKDPPDLVVSDVDMPVMDGHALVHEIRANHPELNEIPFIFLSAQADRIAVTKGRKLGADAYLTKPIDFDMLLLEIESRLTQVERMAQIKEEELVKLYKAMSNK